MEILNSKQQRFISEYLKCNNATYAVQIAYGYKDKNVAGVTGSRLLRNAKVKSMIQEALQGKGIDTSLVLNTLRKNLIEGAGIKAKASDSNRAAELLLKVSGMLDREKSRPVNNQYNFFTKTENLSTTEILKRREQSTQFFSEILEGETV